MKRILGVFSENNYKIFPSEKINLDRIPREEYQDENEIFAEGEILEADKSGQFRNVASGPSGSLFKYFLDGSRKVYKIAEINTEKKFLPILAAQIGVACCSRKDRIVHKFDVKKRNLVLIPDCINSHDVETIKTAIKRMTVAGIRIDDLVEYEFSKKSDKKPVDLGLAKVIIKMHALEIDMIEAMIQSNKLDTDAMLIIDGSLQISDKRVNAENFRNVIGISKSYDVHYSGILKGKNVEIGTALVKLKYGQRTPVYKRVHNKIVIGAWYLRIRNEMLMKNPLDGVIKVEKIANEREDEHISGFDSDMIDNISRAILSERNVTCYGSDHRWPNHLYPVFLTESLIKNSFISDTYFMNIF